MLSGVLSLKIDGVFNEHKFLNSDLISFSKNVNATAFISAVANMALTAYPCSPVEICLTILASLPSITFLTNLDGYCILTYNKFEKNCYKIAAFHN